MSQPLKSSNSGFGRACILVFGVIFGGAGCLVSGGALVAGSIFGALFGLPFLAIGIGFLIWGILPWVVGMKMGKPDVSLSKTAVGVGEPFTFTYRQTFSKPVTVNGMSIQFLMRESATYQQGTDTYTVTHEKIADEVKHPARNFGIGEVFTENRTFQVPPDGMHTFLANRNKIRWHIRMRVEIAGWPDLREEYEVQVLPQRAGA